MAKKWGLALLTLALATGLTACGNNNDTSAGASPGTAPTGAEAGSGNESSGEPTKLSLALSSWVGFAPLYIAQEKGFFKEHGLDVELVKMESVADRRSTLAANRIQGFTSTVDTHVVTAASGVPVVQVVALDDSYGGDGLVAKKEIKSLKDLVGKTVAVQTDGGASFFWFLYLLNKEGIDEKDIKLQSMTAGDAGAAFAAKKVDAAVTWEPWLSKAKDTDFGSVLVSSDATPGVIADTIGLRKDFADANPDAVKALAQSWFEAVEYYKTNEEDAVKIMARAFDQTTDEFKAGLSGVRYYDQARNQEYFGTKEQPGALRELTELGAKFWLDHKLIDSAPDIDSLIDYSAIR